MQPEKPKERRFIWLLPQCGPRSLIRDCQRSFRVSEKCNSCWNRHECCSSTEQTLRDLYRILKLLDVCAV